MISSIDGRPAVLRRLILLLVAIGVSWSPFENCWGDDQAKHAKPNAQAQVSSESTIDDQPPDCGRLSLALLLDLTQRSISLDQLEKVLPITRASGLSMLELKESARRFGLILDGVRLRARPGVIDRPMILYFQRGEHGHFVVARPVGHTGRLVQVLDPLNALEILDQSTLVAHPDWTGLALVPSDDRLPGIQVVALVALAGLAALSADRGIRVLARRRRLAADEVVSTREVHP